jgi:hypothetical protein
MLKRPATLVFQVTTDSGAGNLLLTAVSGKRTFAAAFGSGPTVQVFDYFISHRTAMEWERGLGHMSNATTLVRDVVLQSSNSNAAVVFSTGTKDVTNGATGGSVAHYINIADYGDVYPGADITATLTAALQANGKTLVTGVSPPAYTGSPKVYLIPDPGVEASPTSTLQTMAMCRLGQTSHPLCKRS